MKRFRNINSIWKVVLLWALSFGMVVLPCQAQQSFGQSMGSRKNTLLNNRSQGNYNVRTFGTPREQNDVLGGDSQNTESVMQSAASGGSLFQTVTPTSYAIHVLGEVPNPGVYRLSPSDRVVDAIKYAGGLLPSGSNRAIQLRRQSSQKNLDLLMYTMRGNLSQNPYLADNDVIFVPLKKGSFEVEGAVKRPGIYEITKPVNIKSAVELAGGYTVGRSVKASIRVIRYNIDEKKEIIEIENNADLLKDYKIKNGDIIVIPNVMMADKKFDYNFETIPGDNLFYPTSDAVVYVIGAVAQPGAYDFKTYYKSKEYVNMSGPLKDAKLKGVKIIRADGKKEYAKLTTSINPGDTILVPTKSVTAQNFVTWASTLLSLTSTSLSTYFLVKDLRN